MPDMRILTTLVMLTSACNVWAQHDRPLSGEDTLFRNAFDISYALHLNVHFSNFRYGSFYQQRDPSGGFSNGDGIYPLDQDFENQLIITYPPLYNTPYDSVCFLLDTTNKVIRNFNYFDNGFGKPEKISIHFDSIPYTLDSFQHLRAEVQFDSAGSSFTYGESYQLWQYTYYSDNQTYMDAPSTVTIDAAPNEGLLSIKTQSSSINTSGLSITIYPNSRQAHVHFNPQNVLSSLSIFDVLGRKLKEFSISANATECYVPLWNLSQGFYIFQLNSELAKIFLQ